MRVRFIDEMGARLFDHDLVAAPRKGELVDLGFPGRPSWRWVLRTAHVCLHENGAPQLLALVSTPQGKDDLLTRWTKA